MSTPERLLSIGCVAKLADVIVPVKAAPAPGALNATGPFVVGENFPFALSVATIPLRILRSGAELVTSAMSSRCSASSVELLALLVARLASRSPSANGCLPAVTVKRMSISLGRFWVSSNVP